MYGESERVLRELYRGVGEGKMTMQAEPGVVEPKPHERQEEVNLLVDLRHGVPDGKLEVAIVIVAPLIKEWVELALPDGVQPVWGDHILRNTRVSISFRVGWWSVPRCPRI